MKVSEARRILLEQELEKLTHSYTGRVDEAVKAKESELLEV